MRGFFFAGVALGALVGGASAKDELPNPQPLKAQLEQLSSLLASSDQPVSWEDFSPSSLGMKLNFDEMTQEQLRQIALGFKDLGLIPPEEVGAFMVALQDPEMRLAMKRMSDNWPETIKAVLGDPNFKQFLMQHGGNPALSKIVGIKSPLQEQGSDIE